MITNLNSVVLKSGESVRSAILSGPDLEWAEPMLDMLSHKGEPWNWQNMTVLTHELGVDAFFYILYRDSSPSQDGSGGDSAKNSHTVGLPFANIMTIERDGVGIFGHVWTKPEDRQQGASALLMQIQMADFAQRQGRALYLTTGNPVAHRLYEKYGFQEVAPNTGLMIYTTDPLDQFETSYFGNRGELTAAVQPLDWPHWPAASPLFFGGTSGLVRAASMGLIGRSTPESAFLSLLHRAAANPEQSPRAMILELANGAVAGLALWERHPIWPGTCIVDLYCHENYWSHGKELLNSLELPKATRLIAYSEDACPQKNQILVEAGFTVQATLPGLLPGAVSSGDNSDLRIYLTQS